MAECNDTSEEDIPTQKRDGDGCVFCQIANGKKETDFVYSDDDYVCFVDIKPHATHHYLVVPRSHHQNVKYLNSEQSEIVKRMGEIGRQILQEKGCDLNDSRLGFHWPPFQSIEHLHMHVLSPVSSMSFLSRRVVFRHNYPLVTLNWAQDYLKNRVSTK